MSLIKIPEEEQSKIGVIVLRILNREDVSEADSAFLAEKMADIIELQKTDEGKDFLKSINDKMTDDFMETIGPRMEELTRKYVLK